METSYSCTWTLICGSCWVSTLAYPNLLGTEMLYCCCCCWIKKLSKIADLNFLNRNYTSVSNQEGNQSIFIKEVCLAELDQILSFYIKRRDDYFPSQRNFLKRKSTCSQWSGRQGGPPCGGLKISSSNSNTLEAQGGNSPWSRNPSDSTRSLTSWRLSLKTSSLTISRRIAVWTGGRSQNFISMKLEKS
jgi:hypothetical protein